MLILSVFCRASYALIHYTPVNVFSQSFHWMKLSETDDEAEDDADEDASVCRPLHYYSL